MRVRVLGAHSSTTVAAGCTSLLIDGCLALDAGSIASALSLEEQGRLQTILLSHEHFDHIRDLPLLALNLYRQGQQIAVHSAPEVLECMEANIFNGMVYPRFHRIPDLKPTLHFCPIEPSVDHRICDYDVRAIPVNHHGNTTGYAVTDQLGNSIFYTADTGSGLRHCWAEVRPHVLFVEVTLPDRYQEYAVRTGHLTPAMLLAELDDLYSLQGYLPRVVALHLDPTLEEEIRAELAELAEIAHTPFIVATEGMELNVELPVGVS